MEKCYKCGNTEELSRKSKSVSICKPCRRLEYRVMKEANPDYNKKTLNRRFIESNAGQRTMEEWEELSNMTVKRISARFR